MNDWAVFEELTVVPEPEGRAAFSRLYAAERSKALQLLIWAKEHRPDRLVAALRLIGSVADIRLVAPMLFDLVRSADPGVRSASALLLARNLRNPEAIRHLFAHADSRVRAAVVEGIREWSQDPELLSEPLQDPHHRVLTTAIVNLYGISQREALRMLQRCLAGDDWRLRAAASWAIGAIGRPELRRLAERMRSDNHPAVRWNALRALSMLHRSSAQT